MHKKEKKAETTWYDKTFCNHFKGLLFSLCWRWWVRAGQNETRWGHFWVLQANSPKKHMPCSDSWEGACSLLITDELTQIQLVRKCVMYVTLFAKKVADGSYSSNSCIITVQMFSFVPYFTQLMMCLWNMTKKNNTFKFIFIYISFDRSSSKVLVCIWKTCAITHPWTSLWQ